MAIAKGFYDKCPVKIAVYHVDNTRNTLHVFDWGHSDAKRRENFGKARNQLLNYRINTINHAQFYDKATNELIGEYKRNPETGTHQFYGNVF